MQDPTAAWYDTHAQAYAAQADNLNMSHLLKPFLAALPATGTILDIGCGSGRDLDALHQAGRRVLGWEPCANLANIARARGHDVAPYGYADLPLHAPKNLAGIWSCASLLHLPLIQWPATLTHLRASLRPGGVLLVSIKDGCGTWTDAQGRVFHGTDADTFRSLFSTMPHQALAFSQQRTSSTRPNTTQLWNTMMLQA